MFNDFVDKLIKSTTNSQPAHLKEFRTLPTGTKFNRLGQLCTKISEHEYIANGRLHTISPHARVEESLVEDDKEDKVNVNINVTTDEDETKDIPLEDTVDDDIEEPEDDTFSKKLPKHINDVPADVKEGKIPDVNSPDQEKIIMALMEAERPNETVIFVQQEGALVYTIFKARKDSMAMTPLFSFQSEEKAINVAKQFAQMTGAEYVEEFQSTEPF